MAQVTKKRRASTRPRRAKRAQFASDLRSPLYFDSLPIEVNASIARKLVDHPDYQFPGGQAAPALTLLEAGGALADGAKTEFQSWTECSRGGNGTGLWLCSYGKEGYKITRRLASLMGESLHSITFRYGMTKLYANIIRVHAKGLRRVHVPVGNIPVRETYKVEAVLKACGDLECVSVQLHENMAHVAHALATCVSRFKHLTLTIQMRKTISLPLETIWKAAAVPGSRTRAIDLNFVGPLPNWFVARTGCDNSFIPPTLSSLKLHILRNATPPIRVRVEGKTV